MSAPNTKTYTSVGPYHTWGTVEINNHCSYVWVLRTAETDEWIDARAFAAAHCEFDLKVRNTLPRVAAIALQKPDMGFYRSLATK